MHDFSEEMKSKQPTEVGDPVLLSRWSRHNQSSTATHANNCIFFLLSLLNFARTPSIIQSITIQDKEKPIINFISGNEQTGLPLFVHHQIPIFHIGGYSSEPLRASQAASYALGTLGCLKKDY